MRAGTRQTLEVRQRVQRNVHFAGGAAELVAPNVFQKFSGQLVFFNELDEGKARVDAGRNHIAVDFVAILQHHAPGVWNLNSSGIVVTGTDTYIIAIYMTNQDYNWGPINHVAGAAASLLP